MLLAALLVWSMGSTRLLIWFIDQRTRRFTLGMLAIAGVSTLFVPEIGQQTVDPATRFLGANTSNIGMHLLTFAACYEFAAGLNRDWPQRTQWIWRALYLTAAAVVLVTYPLSDQIRVPADEFALGDIGSLVQQWTVAITIAAAFAIIAVTALINLRKRGPDMRLTMGLTFLFGLAGFGMGTATLILLAVDRGWLHQHYRAYVTPTATIGLILLAASGIPGLIRAWLGRNNPRS